MNDILLTPEEMYDTANPNILPRYRRHWVDGGKRLPPEYEALCRAQVRKVREWLDGDCTEHDPPAYVMALPMQRLDCVECLAALKAAGGE